MLVTGRSSLFLEPFFPATLKDEYIFQLCFVFQTARDFDRFARGFLCDRARIQNVNLRLGVFAHGRHKPIFPEPRLQVDYYGDLSKMRQQWSEEVNGYSWVDKNAGVTRIPIERAMQLTLQRGLPARTPGATIRAS